MCATNPPVAHLLCGVLLLHENLQTLISKRSEQDIVCDVLCPFPDMSLAKTAGSCAVDIVYICEYSQVCNSTAQARAVWWDLEKYNNFEGLPPYVDFADATAAAAAQSRTLEGAAVGRAGAAADGDAGGGFGGTGR